MDNVLIIERDPVWRCSLRRHLTRLGDLEVVEAASYAEAICLIALERPQLIIFDIDTDERFDAHSLGNLELPALNIPLLCISGQDEPYRDQIARRDGVFVFPKPVSLRNVEQMVRQRLGSRTFARSPFGVVEYVQLACLCQHSVVIETVDSAGATGAVVIRDGTLWSARLADGQSGNAAFQALASRDDVRLVCKLLEGEPGPRCIDTPWESLLIDAARRRDEKSRAAAL